MFLAAINAFFILFLQFFSKYSKTSEAATPILKFFALFLFLSLNINFTCFTYNITFTCFRI